MKNKEMYIVYIGITFLVAIIISIIVMFVTPTAKTKEDKLNEYKEAEINVKDIVKRYVSEILILISNGEAEKLWKITDKNFLELYNIANEQELLKYLKAEGISQLTNIVIRDYRSYEYDNKKIYVVDLKNITEKKMKSITIKETSPKNYEIAFDGFVELHKVNKAIQGVGINLNIRNVVSYEKVVKFDISFVNKTNKNIIIETNFSSDNVVLNYKDKSIFPMNATFGAPKNVFKPRQGDTLKIDFAMSFTWYAEFKSIMLTNVIIDDKKITETYNLK